MTIDLMQFCGTDDDPRLWLQRPFGIGDYTYAANGHILVRVPRSEWPSDELQITNRTSQFQNVLDLMNESPPMASLPAIPPGPYYRKCLVCSASRDVGGVCEECDGDGEIECDCCGHTKNCEACDGTGHICEAQAVCGGCDGEGVIEEATYYRFGSRSFDARYLRMIKALPDSRLAIDGPKMDGALFTFTGGRGLLMPVNEDKGPYPELTT